ncbi:hypothetical protein RXV86_02450 [Alisedimentitalea sp. MJ-SS2]|uniref:hypothetical protein n=1 Tax=Aliisedimentitalea sp. MJ-SS2 TaxID=3049795 RepID=UPI00290E070D|nr:hypothetical protein [Alisedimentitalea sp. MJ-SS2]MDU8926235.1 hypothetical protein [Alisedimentitalea sp. MJ-SS2]
MLSLYLFLSYMLAATNGYIFTDADRTDQLIDSAGMKIATGAGNTASEGTPDAAPKRTKMKTYIFGHSLIETKVPYWINQLAQAAGHGYGFSGQYGFLPGHVATLPPTGQWGLPGIPDWNSDVQSFAAANFDTILLTPANFIQFQSPDAAYPGHRKSAVEFTIELIDWVSEREPGIDIYIYENWPDMATFIANESFPPSPAELAAYHDYVLDDFSDWWDDYHAALVAARPDINIISVPVGPIISRLLTETELSGIKATDLYIDNAPHATDTLNFLAGMATYSGMYRMPLPRDYAVPANIHPLVIHNYEMIAELVEMELGIGPSKP